MIPNLPNERQDVEITDAGRRCAEAHELARLAGGIHRYIAIRLEDGLPHAGGTIYDTREDAERHVGGFASLYTYLMVQPGPMPPAEATRWLELMRTGIRMMRHTGHAPILPTGPGTDRLLLPHQHARLRGLARIMRRR